MTQSKEKNIARRVLSRFLSQNRSDLYIYLSKQMLERQMIVNSVLISIEFLNPMISPITNIKISIAIKQRTHRTI